ncbi:ImuA family protein [Mangrovibacterium lignilyticum]|uniref:ImuA family protein n=1 Tax=Mangrovibacterium lignilyticum TaxID=2668052 RepID=UPI0013D135BF|nr:Error-prone repair protein ImuA [Mangrovibacterium lignilyticum]
MKELAGKKDIIKQLREKILSMEGFSAGANSRQLEFGLGPMNAAFPGGTFPVGATHEFVSPTEASAAAANGFLSGLISALMKKGGICLWVSVGRKLFPPALKFFGIEPHRVIFIDVKWRKDALWVMEQALKCDALVAVVGEVREVSFAESRRLQLAVESSRVTGFLHRQQPRSENTLACVSRWKIRPLSSRSSDGLPGVGFPRVEVELAKIRNGRPGIWQFEWRNESFRPVPAQRPAALAPQTTRKEQNYA